MEHLDENAAIISAAKVTGTAVFDTEGQQLGEIHEVMLDKRSGRIAYAVLSFGGLLGMGQRYHPLPWAILKYDTRQGGYVVGITIDQLKDAPTYAASETPAWSDGTYEARIHDYYNAVPHWSV